MFLQVVSREPGCRVTWEGVVSSLGGVVASSSRPWGQHVGALIGLLTLGCPALLHSLTPIARSYHNRLAHAITQAPSPSTRDALDAHTAKCLLLVSHGLLLIFFCPGIEWTVYCTHYWLMHSFCFFWMCDWWKITTFLFMMYSLLHTHCQLMHCFQSFWTCDWWKLWPSYLKTAYCLFFHFMQCHVEQPATRHPIPLPVGRAEVRHLLSQAWG